MIVRYNGKTDSYYSCSSPELLTVGQEYEVVSIRERDWQTDYVLKGVTGYFNSVWFDEVTPEEKIFVAISRKVPTLGEKYHCSKIEFINERPKLIDYTTSKVKAVLSMGNNIYRVTTNNSVYIVKIP